MTTSTATRSDIADLRAYERERDDFRRQIIELKKRRRVSVSVRSSPSCSRTATPIRFQIQEMARVEKLVSDEAIEGELGRHNPLIPEPGPAVGHPVHRADQRRPAARVASQAGRHRDDRSSCVLGDARSCGCIPEAGHDAQLTREEITAAVHYVHWELTPAGRVVRSRPGDLAGGAPELCPLDRAVGRQRRGVARRSPRLTGFGRAARPSSHPLARRTGRLAHDPVDPHPGQRSHCRDGSGLPPERPGRRGHARPDRGVRGCPAAEGGDDRGDDRHGPGHAPRRPPRSTCPPTRSISWAPAVPPSGATLPSTCRPWHRSSPRRREQPSASTAIARRRPHREASMCSRPSVSPSTFRRRASRPA